MGAVKDAKLEVHASARALTLSQISAIATFSSLFNNRSGHPFLPRMLDLSYHRLGVKLCEAWEVAACVRESVT